MNWLPIDSAPRESECVLLAWYENGEWQVIPGAFKATRGLARSGWVVAAMDNDYLNGGDGLRFRDLAVAPTHWQPLPPPPSTPEQPE
jgi:hypothetical protein